MPWSSIQLKLKFSSGLLRYVEITNHDGTTVLIEGIGFVDQNPKTNRPFELTYLPSQLFKTYRPTADQRMVSLIVMVKGANGAEGQAQMLIEILPQQKPQEKK